ncbi:MAG: energy-coupled thiamine transporter ThiT [Ruminococcaceae bacterium]|nr:energy-coupled thiamine transporter ThiT [Oscillospiraceae bacterium]
MKRNYKQHLLALVEGAMILALAWALDFVCALLPFNRAWINGGGITIGMLPIVYYGFRRGPAWGIGAGVVFSGLQMLMGWYVPPANTWWAILLCILLDYVVAFSILGASELFAKTFGQKHRLLGYGMGAVIVCLLRYVCSTLSGGILWGSYAFEGWNPWVYSIVYNGSYMIPNAILTAALAVLLCRALDPKTLRPMKK